MQRSSSEKTPCRHTGQSPRLLRAIVSIAMMSLPVSATTGRWSYHELHAPVPVLSTAPPQGERRKMFFPVQNRTFSIFWPFFRGLCQARSTEPGARDSSSGTESQRTCGRHSQSNAASGGVHRRWGWCGQHGLSPPLLGYKQQHCGTSSGRACQGLRGCGLGPLRHGEQRGAGRCHPRSTAYSTAGPRQ